LRIGLSSSTIHDPTDRQKGGRHVEPRGAVTPCSCYTGRFPDPSPLTPRGPRLPYRPASIKPQGLNLRSYIVPFFPI
jgi:hypothetical protein